MKTLTNWLKGLIGYFLILLGFIFLFIEPILGIILMLIGAYLRYSSKTYVHE